MANLQLAVKSEYFDAMIRGAPDTSAELCTGCNHESAEQ